MIPGEPERAGSNQRLFRAQHDPLLHPSVRRNIPCVLETVGADLRAKGERAGASPQVREIMHVLCETERQAPFDRPVLEIKSQPVDLQCWGPLGHTEHRGLS
jgi:hypothetical protein